MLQDNGIVKNSELNKKTFDTVEDMIGKLRPSYPIYCLYESRLRSNAKAFLKNFPGRVLYAVKCNPALEILKVLDDAGIRHYDTASLNEIALVRENFKRADCYFMHPVKSRTALVSAHKVYGVDHYVIDHANELDKLVAVLGGGDEQVVLVRVKTPQHDALFKLSEKFGAEPAEAARLLERLEKEGFQTGISFHVGSQCRTPQGYIDALEVVGEVIKMTKSPISYLDVGGGFPAPYEGEQLAPLSEFFQVIRDGATKLGLPNDCVLMCEPGRALVADCMSLITQIHLVKDGAIYINDGVYHSLSETHVTNIKHPIRLIQESTILGTEAKGNKKGEYKSYKIFGPTCDSTDVLPHEIFLPDGVAEGDWLEIGLVGAYSNSMMTKFNGFSTDTFVKIRAEPLTPPYVI